LPCRGVPVDRSGAALILMQASPEWPANDPSLVEPIVLQ
jgi:hypothetical protein